MFTHEQIEAMPERIYKRLRDINTQYLEMLGKRIAEVGEIIPTDVYKLQRIFESGVDIKEIEAAFSKANRMNIREIESLFDDVAEESYNFYEPFYAYRKKPFIPYKANEQLQKHIEALKRTTVGECKNLTQATGFLVYDKNGKIPTKFGNLKAVPTTLSETYTITLDNAVQAATMGATDYQTAMRQALRKLADSGIKTVDYASGYSRRLDTSVRQNILWGIKNLNQELADMVGEDIGADGYEISYHSNPRPNHADMGGQMYAKGKGRTINGVYYPSIDTVQHLLDEYGCLHFKFSVILELSESTYSKKELARLKAKDNKPVVFEGKVITKYEASQKQRTLETAMKYCDDRLTVAKAADNEILILKETERMRQLQNKYHELSKASGLPTKWERTVSGLKTSKKPLTKGGSGGIINHRFSDRIVNVYNESTGYSFTEIEDALLSSDIGKDFAEFAVNNGYNFTMNYDVNVPPYLCGEIDDKEIIVYVMNHDDAKDISRTIIHELSHSRYNWSGTQEYEVNCYLMELIYINGDITEDDIKRVVTFVKENYKHLPEGDMYGY
ncbi:MAG: hypothetical protein IJ300_14075 [Clostridia bacterium]|nr:hypothetical protein [Clostridia bacterium]